jgi:hypothetical protein
MTSCLTSHLNKLNTPEVTVNRFKVENITEIYQLDDEYLKLNFSNLDNSYEYKNCLSIKKNIFEFCKNKFSDSPLQLKFQKDDNFFLNKQKGIIYLNHNIAFIDAKIIENVYESGNNILGLPTSISISEDGSSRLIKYQNTSNNSEYTCYHEIYNLKTKKFEFNENCNNLKSDILFFTMKKVQIPNAINIQIGGNENKNQNIIIQDSKLNLIVEIDSIFGYKKEKPSILLKLLYPVVFLVDIITLPWQKPKYFAKEY